VNRVFANAVADGPRFAHAAKAKRRLSIMNTQSTWVLAAGLFSAVVAGCGSAPSQDPAAGTGQSDLSMTRTGEAAFTVRGSEAEVTALADSLSKAGGDGATLSVHTEQTGPSEYAMTVDGDLGKDGALAQSSQALEQATSDIGGWFRKDWYCVRYTCSGHNCYTPSQFYTNTAAFIWWTSFYCYPWQLPSMLWFGTCQSIPGYPN
jgi:hypothetical protein